MPALGESVTDGTVTQWLKNVGDTVELDEPLLEVSTDKVDTEVPSPIAGVLEKIVVEEDETVEVGAVVAYIGDGSGSSDDSGSDDSEAEAPAEEAPAEEPAEEAPAEEAPAEEKEEEPAPADSGSSEGEEVPMPALGESVTEGTVTQWLKEVGDEVELDEPLLEVSTDKVDTEVPSPVAGTLLRSSSARTRPLTLAPPSPSSVPALPPRRRKKHRRKRKLRRKNLRMSPLSPLPRRPPHRQPRLPSLLRQLPKSRRQPPR